MPEKSPKSLIQARDAHVPFIIDLWKKHKTAVGYLPTQALTEYVARGSVLIAQENGQPAGYLLAKHRMPDCPGIAAMFQIAVAMDSQRHSHGRNLVAATMRAAKMAGNNLIQGWVASDLDIVDFWLKCGFTPVALRSGSPQRKRTNILWRHALKPQVSLRSPLTSQNRSRSGKPFFLPAHLDPSRILEARTAGELDTLLAEISDPSRRPSSADVNSPHPSADVKPALPRCETLLLWPPPPSTPSADSQTVR